MNNPIVRIPVESVEKLIASIDRLSELIQKMDDHKRENETVDMIMDGLISELQADVAKRAAEPVSARTHAELLAANQESKRHAELQEAVTRIENNRRAQDQRAAMDQLAYQLMGGLWE